MTLTRCDTLRPASLTDRRDEPWCLSANICYLAAAWRHHDDRRPQSQPRSTQRSLTHTVKASGASPKHTFVITNSNSTSTHTVRHRQLFKSQHNRDVSRSQRKLMLLHLKMLKDQRPRQEQASQTQNHWDLVFSSSYVCSFQ